MNRELNSQTKIVTFALATFALVIFASAASYGVSENNSDSKPVAVSSSSAGPTLNQSARTSNSQNNSSSAISKVIGVANIGLGAVHLSKFTTTCATLAGCVYSELFQGILHLAMGAQSFQQAGANSAAAGDAALTGIDTSAWNNPFGNPNAPNANSNLLDPKIDPATDRALANVVNTKKFNDIKSQLLSTGIGGVRIDPKSGKIIDTKTGKVYDPAKLTDAKGMADAGFSKGDSSAALSAAGQIEKAAMKKLGLSAEGIGAATAENGTIDGGSASINGGAMSGGSADAGGMSGGRRGIASSGGVGVKIPSNQIAGLSKNFNGERIGVSAENIFNMMARRYKTKEKQNSFFDPSELVKMPQ